MWGNPVIEKKYEVIFDNLFKLVKVGILEFENLNRLDVVGNPLSNLSKENVDMIMTKKEIQGMTNVFMDIFSFFGNLCCLFKKIWAHMKRYFFFQINSLYQYKLEISPTICSNGEVSFPNFDHFICSRYVYSFLKENFPRFVRNIKVVAFSRV